MMKASQLFLLFTFLVSALSAIGQTQKHLDSLLYELSQANKDTNKVHLYRSLSYLYVRSQFELSRLYSDSMLDLSEQLDYEKGKYLAHYQYGLADRFEGNYEKAMDRFSTWYDYNLRIGDSLNQASALFQIGIIHDYLGNYDQSLATLLEALKIYETKNDTSGMARTNNSVGVIYMQLQKLDLALTSFTQAADLYGLLKMATDKAVTTRNMGTIYLRQKKYELATQQFKKAMDLHHQAGNQWGVASSLLSLGDAERSVNNLNQAIHFYEQARENYMTMGRRKELVACDNKLGQAYLELKNVEKALGHFLDGLTTAKEIESKPYIQESLMLLSEAYNLKGDVAKAYDYHKQYVVVKDSIMNEENAKSINELQAKYETEKKEKEIAILAREKEVQEAETKRQATLKKASLGGLAFVILLAGLLIYMLWQRLRSQRLLAKKDTEIRKENFQKQLSQLEMKALRAQMNPHFIFNSMNSINRMILEDDIPSASRYLTKFSKLVRLILENSRNSTVSLKDELDMLETYIQLEARRFKGNIDYQFSIDPEIDQENTMVPSMVLQPFIENAIWHGLMHKKEEGLIKIIIKEYGEQLKCTIEDNGVGREKALELKERKLHKRSSLGLKVTEERLKLISNEQVEGLINFTDLKDAMNHALGTRVDVLIPVS